MQTGVSTDAATRQSLWASDVTPLTIFSVGEALAARASESDVRVAVASSITSGFLTKAIACAIWREDQLPAMYESPFGAYVTDLLDRSSPLYAFAPGAVVIAIDWRDLLETDVDSTIARFEAMWSAVRASGARVFMHLPAPPSERYRGVADRYGATSLRASFDRIVARLYAAGHDAVTWVDVASMAESIGRQRWAPQRAYAAARLPFDTAHLPHYMRAFGGAWRSSTQKEKKVLALDLDGTLWGGVVGDDGVEGLTIGPGSATGEAYAAWGRYLKELRARGVVLAVCSKNDPGIARSAFEHEHAVLALDDFAAFECSWDDKVTGLRRIASRLNVSVDAIVFADDNPAECALVREALPTTGVVELTGDPAAFVSALERDCWFDVGVLTDGDFERASRYELRAKAEEAFGDATDLRGYLASLGMRAHVQVCAEQTYARVAQLEARTNQFNLTTRRYDEQSIRDAAVDERALVAAISLEDRFGNHGIVAACIACPRADAMEIESWVMSCRVFGRTLEEFTLNALAEIARDRGARVLRATYIPTPRNGVVSDLLERLGFVATADGRWEYALTCLPLETAVVLG